MKPAQREPPPEVRPILDLIIKRAERIIAARQNATPVQTAAPPKARTTRRRPAS